jgi:hypothetical protein
MLRNGLLLAIALGAESIAGCGSGGDECSCPNSATFIQLPDEGRPLLDSGAEADGGAATDGGAAAEGGTAAVASVSAQGDCGARYEPGDDSVDVTGHGGGTCYVQLLLTNGAQYEAQVSFESSTCGCIVVTNFPAFQPVL